MAEDISIQSMALQKRNAETALMPPPPPPKRLKRPPKILSEDDYTSAITTIIERDFYPNLSEMRKQTRYLDAVEEGNPIHIATAARRLTTPYTGEVPEEEDEEDKKERILREDVLGMRLDSFQAKYTSEDNESFNSLLDEQNAKQREKFAWKFHGNKKLTKQEFAIEQKKVLLLEEGLDGKVVVPGERTDEEGKWSKETQLWPWNPMNVLMNPHPGLEDQLPDPSQEQKLIRHDNTRVPQPPTTTGKTPLPSPSISTIEDAISGRIRSDTPKVNGYSFVSTPKPTDLGAPKMTWGEITSTPISLNNEKPSPFRIAEPSEREKLARKLAEKAQKDITNRQRAYTPRLRTNTTTLGGGKAVPKFMSSPDVRKTLLTPAGQRLLENSTQGRRSSSRLAMNIVKGKERESAAQVSAGIIGRTPLMRTPLLKDGATPLRKK
jgi:protein DGCR14